MRRVSSSRKSARDVLRLAAQKDTEIMIDEEAPAGTPEMFARAVLERGLAAPPGKTLLSLRVDSDVGEWLVRWQTASQHLDGDLPCTVIRLPTLARHGASVRASST